MNEVKFVNGLFVNRKEQAPDFVISNLSFNEKFIDWLKDNLNAKGWCNIDLLKSKEGKLYAKKNEWKPEGEMLRNDTQKEVLEVPNNYPNGSEIKVEDIPF